MAEEIKNKKGEKIAELSSKPEAIWLQVKENLEIQLENHKKQMEVDKAFLRTAKKELKKARRSK